jgi:hypothetical protein
MKINDREYLNKLRIAAAQKNKEREYWTQRLAVNRQPVIFRSYHRQWRVKRNRSK